MSRTRTLLLILSVVLALVGAALCVLLTSAHLSAGAGLLSLDCGDASSACGRVLNSRWSVFPPADAADVLEGTAPSGVPVAALGLLYFSTLAVWLAFVGVCRGARSRWNGLLLQGIGAGCVVSVVYVLIMATQIGAFCPLCLGTHAVHLALLGTVFAALSGAHSQADDGSDEPQPSSRLALASVLLGLTLGALLWLSLQTLADRAILRTQAERFAALDKKAELVELAYFSDTRFADTEAARQRFDTVVNNDDAELPAAPGTSMTLVIFSDAECPGCGRFETLLMEQILPLFGGHLRVVYKHFPLNIHAHAEPAARALEAARRQGAFWEYKALLDPWRERLGEVDYGSLARQANLDLERFLADWSSSAVVLKVAGDIADGKSLGVDSTPSVFLNRRLVDPLTRGLLGFWSRRAQSLRDTREARGAGW